MGETAYYILPPDVTLQNVKRILKELKPSVEACEDDVFYMDGSEVKTLDGAGLQLLLSCYKALAARNINLSIKDPSEAMGKAIITGGADLILLKGV